MANHPWWLVAVALLLTSTSAASKPMRDARLEDIAVIRTGYVLKSKAFTREARLKALRYLDGLAQSAASISDAEFVIDLLRITGMADNGHDAVDFGYDAWTPTSRLPFRMIWFPDGWIVARAGPDTRDLLGARIESIEGLTPDELFARLRPLGGGTDAYRKWNLEWVVENGGLLRVSLRWAPRRGSPG